MRPRSDGRPFEEEAVVDPDLCVNCGICVGSCPVSTPFRQTAELVTGIDLPEFTLSQLRDATREAMGHLAGARGGRVLVFGCACGPEVAALAGHGVATVSLPCVRHAAALLHRLGLEWRRRGRGGGGGMPRAGLPPPPGRALDPGSPGGATGPLPQGAGAAGSGDGPCGRRAPIPGPWARPSRLSVTASSGRRRSRRRRHDRGRASPLLPGAPAHLRDPCSSWCCAASACSASSASSSRALPRLRRAPSRSPTCGGGRRGPGAPAPARPP